MTIHEHALQPLVSGLGFGEAPRWHEDALWISDIARREVLRIDTASGAVQRILSTPGEPSGLGWLPDGSLLVVQMEEHEVLRWHRGNLSLYSRTGAVSRSRLNDMVVDRNGRAWVSNMGFDYESEPRQSTNLVGLEPDGRALAAATELWCPNGMAINPANTLLVVGQSASREILSFRIASNGELCDRAVFGTHPKGGCSDGLCMDAAGALWIASPTTHEFLRMEPGGNITDRVATGERHAIACVLGGPERRTLFCLTAATLSIRAARLSTDGRVESVRVAVPGAGTP